MFLNLKSVFILALFLIHTNTYMPSQADTTTHKQRSRMIIFNAITVHPEIQDGAPVFSGTRIRVETFFDFLRVGVSVPEFLNEFPSISRDQAMEVYDLMSRQYTIEQIAAMAVGPENRHGGRVFAQA